MSLSATLPPPELQERVERVCGKKSASWVAPGFGLSAAHRFCVRFSDDSAAFVKAALFSGIQEVTSTRAPEALGNLQSRVRRTWSEIAMNPEPFLRLGLCSEEWYQQVIDALLFAEQNVATEGETLLHGDVRSDNVCFRGSCVVFVDWAEAMRGNPEYDLACVLPTLHLEGGPRPFDVFPDGGEWAALLSGMLVKRTCTDLSAPDWLINVFKRLVAIELEWAAASLRLPQVDGTNWREI